MKQGLIAVGGAYVDINVPQFPVPEEGLQLETEVVGHQYRVEPGGSAVNFARLCASMGIPTTFVGKVGQDAMGELLVDLLKKAHVTPELVHAADVSTSVSFNMVNDDGKSIMAVAGTANQVLTADEVYERVSNMLSEAEYLCIGGCFKLKQLMPAFERLAHDAQAAGVRIVLDHGRLNSGVTAEEKEVVKRLALAADVYMPSTDEFMQLWQVDSVAAGLAMMAEKGCGVTVVKNGSDGVVSFVNGDVVKVPAFAVTPLHTVGAGDSFNAGFVAAQLQGKDLVDSMTYGCATAALKISREELPTWQVVEELIGT